MNTSSNITQLDPDLLVPMLLDTVRKRSLFGVTLIDPCWNHHLLKDPTYVAPTNPYETGSIDYEFHREWYQDGYRPVDLADMMRQALELMGDPCRMLDPL